MHDPTAYLKRLRRRYRRFFIVDQIVWVLYGMSAVLPAWGLLNYPGGKLFHATGMILIVSVASLGFWSNRMLLRNNPNGKTVGLVTTTLLLASRIGMLWYAIVVAARSLSMHWSDIDLFGDVVIATTWILAIVGFYRLLHHISAHFYVKLFIENVEQTRCSEPGDGAPVGNRGSVAPGH